MALARDDYFRICLCLLRAPVKSMTWMNGRQIVAMVILTVRHSISLYFASAELDHRTAERADL